MTKFRITNKKHLLLTKNALPLQLKKTESIKDFYV